MLKSFKGALFYIHFKSTIFDSQSSVGKTDSPTLSMIKKRVKGLLFNVQCQGDENEWEGANTPPYNVPGLPRQKREITYHVNYAEP